LAANTTPGAAYEAVIQKHILRQFDDRGVQVYKQVQLGRTPKATEHRVDLLVLSGDASQAVAVECKFQGSRGTTDEKLFYAIEVMKRLPCPGIIAYAGEGMSDGAVQLLRTCGIAAYCLPRESAGECFEELRRATAEFDRLLAASFGWWDYFVPASPRA